MGGSNNSGMMGGSSGFGGPDMQSAPQAQARPVITQPREQRAPQPTGPAAAKDSWTQGLVNLDLGPKKPQQLSSGVKRALACCRFLHLCCLLVLLFSWHVSAMLACVCMCEGLRAGGCGGT